MPRPKYPEDLDQIQDHAERYLAQMISDMVAPESRDDGGEADPLYERLTMKKKLEKMARGNKRLPQSHTQQWAVINSYIHTNGIPVPGTNISYTFQNSFDSYVDAYPAYRQQRITERNRTNGAMNKPNK